MDKAADAMDVEDEAFSVQGRGEDGYVAVIVYSVQGCKGTRDEENQVNVNPEYCSHLF